jgi:exosome complex component RRP41
LNKIKELGVESMNEDEFIAMIEADEKLAEFDTESENEINTGTNMQEDANMDNAGEDAEEDDDEEDADEDAEDENEEDAEEEVEAEALEDILKGAEEDIEKKSEEGLEDASEEEFDVEGTEDEMSVVYSVQEDIIKTTARQEFVEETVIENTTTIEKHLLDTGADGQVNDTEPSTKRQRMDPTV